MIQIILLCVSFSTTMAFTCFVLPYMVIKGIDDDDGSEDIDDD